MRYLNLSGGTDFLFEHAIDCEIREKVNSYFADAKG